MSYLLNPSTHLIDDALTALVRCSAGRISRLDGSAEGVHAVVRSDVVVHRDAKVSIICGGGSGHEPAYASMVGAGLLDGAVCGDVFASPSATAVEQTISAVCGAAGCVVVVMNYMGDRLNFGKAVGRAKAKGLKVELIIVADDAALDTSNARGIAGTILALKAGAAKADTSAPLAEVCDTIRGIAGKVKTYGFALSACTLPGGVKRELGGMELGLGIHGEPGREVVEVEPSREVAARVVAALVESMGGGGGGGGGENMVLLVNNLGTMIPLEMTTYTADALAACEAKGLCVTHFTAGSFVTSLNMHGASLTLLPASDTELTLLLAPTACPSWVPLTTTVDPPALIPLSCGDVVTPTAVPLGCEAAASLRSAVEAACTALVEAEEALNALDRKVGDGDCGTTMRRGAEQVLADAPAYAWEDLGRIFDSLASSMEHMGGTAGALFVLAAEAAATAVRSGASLGTAFVAAVDAVVVVGGARVGSCTMVDALLPAAEVVRGGDGGDVCLAAVTAAAAKGRDSTAALTASHGRSSYLVDADVFGVIDPGAAAVCIMLEAAKSVQ